MALSYLPGRPPVPRLGLAKGIVGAVNIPRAICISGAAINFAGAGSANAACVLPPSEFLLYSVCQVSLISLLIGRVTSTGAMCQTEAPESRLLPVVSLAEGQGLIAARCSKQVPWPMASPTASSAEGSNIFIVVPGVGLMRILFCCYLASLKATCGGSPHILFDSSLTANLQFFCFPAPEWSGNLFFT